MPGSLRAWLPGQHALAKQLKRFSMGSWCLHVPDGRELWVGRPRQGISA